MYNKYIPHLTFLCIALLCIPLGSGRMFLLDDTGFYTGTMTLALQIFGKFSLILPAEYVQRSIYIGFLTLL